MSFFLTQDQMRRRAKRVTRRLGSLDAKPGDMRQPIVKGQGLKKGEKVQRINGPIRFVSVRRERLDAITPEDVIAEGFPGMSPLQFVQMFCRHNGCRRNKVVTRIEFEYLEADA